MTIIRKAEAYRGTILVISEDITFLTSLHSIFGSRGYRIVSEMFGDELVKIVNKIKPDVAIIDIMPSMTGIVTAMQLRINTTIPTILLSNWETGWNTFRRLDVYDPSGLSDPIGPDELGGWVDAAVSAALGGRDTAS